MPVQRSVQIVNEAGIHARPAAEIVKTAARFKSDITIVKDGLDVNAKSIMGVMMLAAECGSTVLLTAEGEDEQDSVDAIADVIAAGFGEALGEI